MSADISGTPDRCRTRLGEANTFEKLEMSSTEKGHLKEISLLTNCPYIRIHIREEKPTYTIKNKKKIFFSLRRLNMKDNLVL